MKKENFGDSKLVLINLKNQDHQTFEKLVLTYHKNMLIVARGIVGSSIAEEVVQEAWVSIYKALPKFEGRSSIKTWLFTIVSNKAKTRLRKESRLARLNTLDNDPSTFITDQRFNSDGNWSSPPPTWEIASPDKLIEESQLRKCLELTLETLPPAQKSAFILRDIEQLDMDEICNILDLSRSNIRVRLHRARLKFMQVIEQYQETGKC
jgi:RNA polymerase sigma-70 factor, ECF subfamily